MGAGQHVHFAPDRTNVFQSATVQTNPLLENHVADRIAMHVVEITVDHEFLSGQGLGGKVFLDERLLDGIDLAGAEFLVGHAFTGAIVTLLIAFFANQGLQGLIVHFMAVFAFGFAYFLGQIQLHLALYLDGLMGGLQGLDHHLLAHFLHFAFHHRDVVDRGTHHQFQVGLFHLGHRRVDDELAVHTGHANFGYGTVERNIGNGKGRGRGQGGESIGQVVAIARNEIDQHLGVGMVVVGEQGTQSPVDQTGNQDFIFRKTSFALEKTAGETSHGSVFLLIIHRKGHEVDVLAHFGLAADRSQDHGVATFDDSRTVGLLGQFARFDNHLPAIGQVEFFLCT